MSTFFNSVSLWVSFVFGLLLVLEGRQGLKPKYFISRVDYISYCVSLQIVDFLFFSNAFIFFKTKVSSYVSTKSIHITFNTEE